MSDHLLVALVVVVGASIAAMTAWILVRVMFNEEDSERVDLLFSITITFALALTAGFIAHIYLGIAAGAIAFSLGAFPGYLLVKALGACMPEPSSKSSKSSKPDDDLDWKVWIAIIAACVTAALTGGIAVTTGLPAATAVALLGAPLMAVWSIGATLGSLSLLLVLFCGGIPRLGRALDRQADRISAMLRKKITE